MKEMTVWTLWNLLALVLVVLGEIYELPFAVDLGLAVYWAIIILLIIFYTTLHTVSKEDWERAFRLVFQYFKNKKKLTLDFLYDLLVISVLITFGHFITGVFYGVYILLFLSIIIKIERMFKKDEA